MRTFEFVDIVHNIRQCLLCLERLNVPQLFLQGIGLKSPVLPPKVAV